MDETNTLYMSAYPTAMFMIVLWFDAEKHFQNNPESRRLFFSRHEGALCLWLQGVYT